MDANFTEMLVPAGSGAVGVGAAAWWLFKKLIADMDKRHADLEDDTDKKIHALSEECRSCRTAIETRLKLGDERFHSLELQIVKDLSVIKEKLIRLEAEQDFAKKLAKEIVDAKHKGE